MELQTVKDYLLWSYANIAAYRIALQQTPPHYVQQCWMVRAKLYKGLKNNTMKMSTFYKNERVKLSYSNICAYCGSKNDKITLDHLFAKSLGGSDSGNNLIYCCSKCNSSKGKQDYFEWCKKKNIKINPEVAERYIKIKYNDFNCRGLLDNNLNQNQPIDDELNKIPLHYDI